MSKIHATLAVLLFAVSTLGAANANAQARPKQQPSRMMPKEQPVRTAPREQRSQKILKEPSSKTWKTTSAAHLRGAPSGQSPVVASVPKDAALTSSEPCARRWCPVEYKGFRGWIFDVFLVEQPEKAGGPAVEPSSKPGLARTSAAAAPRPSAIAAPPAKEAVRASNRVIVGLEAQENLPVREGPRDAARVIKTLPPGAKNITQLETCVRQWCFIEHDGVRGYVHSRFLARTEAASSPRYGVDGEADLKVLSHASSDAGVVGEIPFYAAGIVPIGDCNGEWCHVRYLGLVGFVEARRLREEAASGG